MKTKHSIFILFFFFANISFSQNKQYNYKKELSNIADQWHQVILPNEIFGKVKNDFSDIRIFGMTQNDTIEAPYILQHHADEVLNTVIDFKLINQSKNDDGYFFTFEIPSEKTINQIDLDFQEKNFDTTLKLEGSHDQREWFTIVDDYRILSIQNEWMDYSFSKIKFPSSKYQYFRIALKGKKKMQLDAASINSTITKKGIYNNYPTKSFQVKENKKLKHTIIDVDLGMKVPLCHLNIEVDNDFDYYRPVTIKYLSDSIQTQTGWKYIYRKLTSGTLTSLESEGFNFNNIIAQKLQIIISNHDNEPLQVKAISTKGFVFELIARMNQSAQYFLFYGNKKAKKPRYDIHHFANKISSTLKMVQIGREQIINTTKPESNVKSLFENKLWLWVIMIFIIGLLAWFTSQMVQNEG